MKITNLTIKRPVTTFMFYLAVILLGFVSLRELSVDLLPDISYPRLSVVTGQKSNPVLASVPLTRISSR